MNKIADAFAGGKALIAYLMAGDPDLGSSAKNILALQAGGADLIEIGIPFSDPIAEGEVIQRASQRALEAGTTTDNVLDMIQGLEGKITIPLVIMTYSNVAFHYGYQRFFSRCAAVGVSGIILPDAPFEEQEEAASVALRYGVELVSLVAPTSRQRVADIAAKARGFLYLVSSMGVTGVRSEITTDIPAMVVQAKQHTGIPVAVGFGISTPRQAAEYAACADGVIVGSAIVRLIEEHGPDAPAHLQAYARSLKGAMAQGSGKPAV